MRARPRVRTTSEPTVHACVGAPFGDYEFDVGKSVRWITWFVDFVSILDVNLGDQRYWVINWAETFPTAKSGITAINYFNRPAEFRKEQWRQFMTHWQPGGDDWVLFIDGAEGFSVDNSSLPDDYDVDPFMSFLWREIARAEALGNTSAVIPHFVFLRSDDIQNISYDSLANDPDAGMTAPLLQSISTPYYLPYRGMRRLWRCSELFAADFDWGQLDRYEDPVASAKVQIISYSFAHWNLQDITPPETTVPPLDASNDWGWTMRNLISRVRPVPGLPLGGWVDPSTDPAGDPGPWCLDITLNTNPGMVLKDEDGNVVTPPVPSAATEGIKVPLYDTIFRLNMRDGVWYEAGVSGNIPLRWDDTSGTWVSDYDPETWPTEGVRAHDPVAPTR